MIFELQVPQQVWNTTRWSGKEQKSQRAFWSCSRHPEEEAPGIEGPNQSRRERKRMKGKRGLDGRLSFLPCPAAEHMARSGGHWSYFGAEQRGAKRLFYSSCPLAEGWGVGRGGEGSRRRSVKTLTLHTPNNHSKRVFNEREAWWRCRFVQHFALCVTSYLKSGLLDFLLEKWLKRRVEYQSSSDDCSDRSWLIEWNLIIRNKRRRFTQIYQKQKNNLILDCCRIRKCDFHKCCAG